MHTPTIEGLQQDQVRCNNITAASGSVVDASVIPTRNGDLSGAPETTSQTLPPRVRLIEMDTAFWASKVVYVAAKLRLADTPLGAALKTGAPRSARSSLLALSSPRFVGEGCLPFPNDIGSVSLSTGNGWPFAGRRHQLQRATDQQAFRT
jgi:hypothetical protein